MATILAERADGLMTVRELAKEINLRGLYRKRDGTAVAPSEIHSRAKTYDDMFEKAGAVVRLRRDA